MNNRALNRVVRYAIALVIVFAGFTLGAWLYLSPTWRYIHGEWWLIPLMLFVEGFPMFLAAYIAGLFDE